MKNPTDFSREYSPRSAAPPISSVFNQPRPAGLSIEALQVDRRWRLFPVQPHSRLASAETRIKDATADMAQLEQWACELPSCNWGLATGAASGVFVLEEDIRSASSGISSLFEDELQQTLLMRAGDTGYAFFRWPAGRAMRGSGKKPAPGLKIRGEGDYVLIPPSVCTSGVSHVYLDLDAGIATAPHRLIDSAFAGLEEKPLGKVLAFPKSLSQEASTMAHPPGSSHAKLLQFAARASPSDPRYRVYVYMSFQLYGGRWRCQFLEKDLQTPLPRTLNLTKSEEVIALANRGGGLSNLEGRQALDWAIANGRGGIFLSLTTDQYSQLQMHCRPAMTGSNAE